MEDGTSCPAFQRPREAAPDVVRHRARLVQRAQAGSRDGEMPLRAPPAGRGALTRAGGDEPLVFEPVQRRIDRAGRDVAPEADLDLLEDGPAVTLAPQVHDRHQHRLLEHPEHVRHIYIVDIDTRLSTGSRKPEAGSRKPYRAAVSFFSAAGSCRNWSAMSASRAVSAGPSRSPYLAWKRSSGTTALAIARWPPADPIPANHRFTNSPALRE